MGVLDHVALPVRDPDASLRFYQEVVGVEGAVRTEEYGHVITTGGVHFTLMRGEPPRALGEVHIGVSLPDAAAVRQKREELQLLGVPEVDWCEEPGYVAVKVVDPDGYAVEIGWDEKAVS